ncbi:MAG: DUF1595 domain-containing protein, partial [Bradymonadaceae bacterium]
MNRIGMLILIAGLVAVAMGCHGELMVVDNSTSPESQAGVPGTPGSNHDEPAHTQNPEFPDLPCDDAACRDPKPSAPPRFVRLTHTQWENTIRDLFYLDAHSGLSSSFIQDPLSSGSFDTNVEVLSMTQRLWDHYRIASKELARRTVSDADALGRIMPEGAPDELEARGRAFIESFGARAYRRALTNEEIDSHLALFMEGAALMGSDNAFESGMEMVLRLIVQSPHFVYRTELAHDEESEVIGLSGYERASKL